MRKTYAPTAIVLGAVIGILIAAADHIVLGILAGVAISVIGWIAIRAFEKVVYKATESAANTIKKKIYEKKKQK